MARCPAYYSICETTAGNFTLFLAKIYTIVRSIDVHGALYRINFV